MHEGNAGAEARPAFQLVVAAASAGGLTALGRMLGDLPSDFPLPIAIVQHLDPNHHSVIAEILARRTALRVKQAAQDDVLTGGVVYIAPPGIHLVIDPGRTISLSHSAPVHFVRPAADRLFETAATVCGPIIGIILSGTGIDGAAGVAAIKASGGIVIAQDEESAAFFGMPQAAIDTGAVDYVLPLGEIGRALQDLVRHSS